MLAVNKPTIGPMSEANLSKVREVEKFLLDKPQIEIKTSHEFHAGLYSRTIMIPAGVLITGALIKIETLLILSGDATIVINGVSSRISGYGVIPASAGRKQIFMAHEDTYLTMVFKTSARTIEEAEAEFTDEADMLGSRREQ